MDVNAIHRAMRTCVEAVAGMPYEHRKMVLLAVLTQEVCTLPHGERAEEIAEIARDDLWTAFEGSEAGMQQAITEAARRGL